MNLGATVAGRDTKSLADYPAYAYALLSNA